ncbi:MAG TPA: DUF1206 domain-containing protein [Solirubrobacteraceae bacterium]|jgi:hypothetical protein|nr:DUF1206 domain-containing protein [Solirubrobacteraceae bacterium]
MATSPERSNLVRSARSALRRDSGRETLRILAAIGLVARGLVYGVIGILAFKVAIGAGGKTTSQSGAMQTIARQPFGKVLLIALAIGLGAYALWRVIDAVAGARPDDDGALQRRVSAIGSAIAYAALCVTAVKIIAGAHASSGSPKPAAAGVLGWPGGPVLVAIAGLVVLGVGAYQGYKGTARRFLEDSRTERMGQGTKTAFTALGVVGHISRAVTFILIGYGLIKAALDYSPKRAVGLDGALQKLAHASAGPVLLGIVALGFIAFALYSIADARYHRV